MTRALLAGSLFAFYALVVAGSLLYGLGFVAGLATGAVAVIVGQAIDEARRESHVPPA